MKKIFLITTLLFCGIAAHSQAALFVLIFGDKVASENFYLSLDVGANFSSMGLENTSGITGLNFGLGAHIKLEDSWYIEAGFKPLSEKGASDLPSPVLDYPDFNITESDVTLEFNYLEVPVLLTKSLPSGWSFAAGPQISFLLSAKEVFEATAADGTDVEITEDLSDFSNSIDWSFPVEAAYKVQSVRKGKGLDLKLRYAYGFNDALKNGDLGASNHSTFQFIVSFPFVEK